MTTSNILFATFAWAQQTHMMTNWWNVSCAAYRFISHATGVSFCVHTLHFTVNGIIYLKDWTC